MTVKHSPARTFACRTGGLPRIAVAVIIIISSFGGVASAGHGACVSGELSEGENDLSGGTCWTLDVPEGVDVLSVAVDGYGLLRRHDLESVCTFDESSFSCDVPGPAPELLQLRTFGTPAAHTAWIRFSDAVPVTGATAGGDLRQRHSGAMYRFEGLEHAAIISLASIPDVVLSVRRGAPPSRTEADCVTNAATFEWCQLGAGVGAVYAFVSFRLPTSYQVCDVPPGYCQAIPMPDDVRYAYVVSAVGV